MQLIVRKEGPLAGRHYRAGEVFRDAAKLDQRKVRLLVEHRFLIPRATEPGEDPLELERNLTRSRAASRQVTPARGGEPLVPIPRPAKAARPAKAKAKAARRRRAPVAPEAPQQPAGRPATDGALEV